MLLTELDMTGYSTAASGVLDALIGTGAPGDATEFTRAETRLLAMEIATAANAPTSTAATKVSQSVKRGIGSVLAPEPPNTFDGVQRGYGDTHWLMAGPSFLAGVPAELDRRDIGIEAAVRLQRGNRGKFGKKKYRMVGQRGGQHVQLLDRFLISRSVSEGIMSRALSHIGRLGASFAQTAQLLGARRIPTLWKKHFPTPKNIHDESGLQNRVTPSITFGSRAPGMGQPWAAEMVQRCVGRRTAKMYNRLDRILSGYAQDHNTGHRAKRHAVNQDNE